MKRLSPTKKQINKVLARKRWHQNCLKIRKRRQLRGGGLLEPPDLTELRARQRALPKPEFQAGTWMSPWGLRREIRLLAPEHLNLGSSFKQTMAFVEEYRHVSFVKRRRSPTQRHSRAPRHIADLSPIKTMSINAALIIAAEFDRVKRFKNFRPQIVDDRWNPTIRTAWSRLGLYDLVHASNPPTDEEGTDASSRLRFVRFISGRQVDSPLANELLNRLAEALGQAPSDMGLYGGLIEAIMNVRSHAYSPPTSRRAIPQLERWWAGGAYNPIAGKLHVSVYDQGQGIPATLATRPWFPALLRLATEHSDAKKIQLARIR